MIKYIYKLCVHIFYISKIYNKLTYFFVSEELVVKYLSAPCCSHRTLALIALENSTAATQAIPVPGR